jgi:hypothetical protein
VNKPKDNNAYLKPKVVIVLSDKRSGSTFLEKELVSHPDINHVKYTPHTYNETHYWVKAARLLNSSRQLFSGGNYPESYGNARQARKSLIATVCRNIPGFEVPENDLDLVFNGWEALCGAFACPVFIEKTPHHIHNWAALELMLQWAEKTSFDVQFVGLIRNPVAVMYSAFKLFGTDPEKRQFGWLDATRNLLMIERLVGEQSFLWVKYEELVGNPGKEFSRLCDFIGLSSVTSMGKSAHTKSDRLWVEDEQFLLQLDPAIKRFAQQFYYSEQELFNPSKSHSSLKLKSNIKRVGMRAYSRLYNFYKRKRL